MGVLEKLLVSTINVLFTRSFQDDKSDGDKRRLHMEQSTAREKVKVLGFCLALLSLENPHSNLNFLSRLFSEKKP
ncbi:hypothetical protein [Rufibacter tibetensis]|uniref:Uncharacterized protein n=1 Tax=Rufibacter tibetensis TaxID=512763 RepID=A0A0P0CMM8_9BACT|nr:hypothetical protein [Rufibacter tibetensis]ALI98233.1 hypothetical protein DC20_03600 [Rufibacter tibetensis]